MTMARYHLPSGVTPDKDGVTPEIGMDKARQTYRQAHPNSKRRIVDYALEEALSVLRK
jgi:C-terminal processing protease CtpA/Prc